MMVMMSLMMLIDVDVDAMMSLMMLIVVVIDAMMLSTLMHVMDDVDRCR